MHHQLTRFIRRLQRQDQMPAASTAYPPLTEALEQTAGLDARTGWPTHRIRCFLQMQHPSHKTG